MVTKVIYVKLSFAENAKKKVKNRHTWLTIPSKCVHQISKTNILVYCTDFALYERILREFLITFATGYKKTTDMNITSSMSSNGNNKKLDGEILYLRSRSRS